MSDTAGASALLDTGASDGALTPEQAWSKLGELRSSTEFKERYGRGDPAARDAMAKVTQGVMGGVAIVPGPGVDPNQFGEGVASAAAARAALETEVVIDTLRRTANIPEPVADMIRKNTEVSLQERRLAEQERQRLMGDTEFVKAWLAGGRDQRTRLLLVDVILARPVKQ